MEGIVGAQLLSAQPLLAGKLHLTGINIAKLRKTLCKPLSWLAHSLVLGHLGLLSLQPSIPVSCCSLPFLFSEQLSDVQFWVVLFFF